MSDDQILSNIPYCFFEKLETVADDVIKNQYIWDNPKTAKVKYLINFLLSSYEREDLVRDLFSRCVSNEKEFAENLYMTREQIKDTARRKSLGSHGVSHLPLAYLSEVEIDREIEESRAALIELTGGDIEAISYPYGGASATSELVFESAKKNGYISGVTMLRGLNSENDILERPLQLKRFDTNDVFGGKSETTYKRIFHD
jgi:peptidoglycan/xylan/chitin deacetylase (PgdA/CDA1 family)